MAKTPDTPARSTKPADAKAEAAKTPSQPARESAWPYHDPAAIADAAGRSVNPGLGPDRRNERAQPSAMANTGPTPAEAKAKADKDRTDDERRSQAKDRRSQRPSSTERDVERAAGRGNAGRIPAARADAKPVTSEWQLLGDVELAEGHIYLGLIKGVQTEVQWHDGDLFTNNGGSFSLRNTDVTHIRERVEGPGELP